MKHLGYDKRPKIEVPESHGCCVSGWDNIVGRLKAALAPRKNNRLRMAVECYPGVHVQDIVDGLRNRFESAEIYVSQDAMQSPAAIEAMVAPFAGGDDPTFGFMTELEMADWFDPDLAAQMRRRATTSHAELVIVIGCGAAQLIDADIVIYASLSRWEAQNRFRRNEADNLGLRNRTASAAEQYKRAFFIDWRVADRWKKATMPAWDFVLDANDRKHYKMADADAIRRAYRRAVTRPFRVVPYFDPAPWGGQWMKEVCDLDRQAANFGWCFDCVPEENSVLFDFGSIEFELPSIDLVFFQSRELLGDAVFERFGDEFPIRFDFLDTMGGGNLSFQVHPLTEYIRTVFGMPYTQDESYYILDAGADASVYLGLRDGVDRDAMQRDLREAQAGRRSFPAESYVRQWPARKHDHFLIPAGTCHCSGRDTMVLEISATPYIFTFKMWDWDRLGLDGKPRPIHLEHALANLQWDRTERWVAAELINRIEPVAEGDGWKEERTGLHPLEFIETRRHWFTRPVVHRTGSSVHVLNLVEGDEAIVESPEGRFEPFPVRYAETFIVPANVGTYSVRPTSSTRPHATIRASVRY